MIHFIVIYEMVVKIVPMLLGLLKRLTIGVWKTNFIKLLRLSWRESRLLEDGGVSLERSEGRLRKCV